VTNPEREQTAGGVLGNLAGKAKEAAGSLTGNDDLAREGRLQQAQSEAEADARHEAEQARQREAEADLVAEKTETELERERLQTEIAAADREETIEEQSQAARRAAAEKAEHDKTLAETQSAVRLEQEARRAEARANAIDPEEQS